MEFQISENTLKINFRKKLSEIQILRRNYMWLCLCQGRSDMTCPAEQEPPQTRRLVTGSHVTYDGVKPGDEVVVQIPCRASSHSHLLASLFTILICLALTH